MSCWYRFCRLCFRVLFAVLFRWRCFHSERVPATGGVILAGNHVSYLDPPLVGAALKRDAYFLARDSLFRFPIFGFLLRSWHAMPVKRDQGQTRGLRMARDLLGTGACVVLFPEGTRSRSNQLQRARSGIGWVVIHSDTPVVPVRVFGTYEAFGRHRRFPRFRRVQVKYGNPLWFDKLRQEAKIGTKGRRKEIYQEIADEIMRAIGELEPHADKPQFP